MKNEEFATAGVAGAPSLSKRLRGQIKTDFQKTFYSFILLDFDNAEGIYGALFLQGAKADISFSSCIVGVSPQIAQR